MKGFQISSVGINFFSVISLGFESSKFNFLWNEKIKITQGGLKKEQPFPLQVWGLGDESQRKKIIVYCRKAKFLMKKFLGFFFKLWDLRKKNSHWINSSSLFFQNFDPWTQKKIFISLFLFNKKSLLRKLLRISLKKFSKYQTTISWSPLFFL